MHDQGEREGRARSTSGQPGEAIRVRLGDEIEGLKGESNRTACRFPDTIGPFPLRC
jgi:hypothetical protein